MRAEQPVDRWLDALALNLCQLLSDSGAAAGNVCALSLAAQVDGVIPIDADGQPLHPTIIWMDHRANYDYEKETFV